MDVSSLNPKARPQALRIGAEGEPIVLIDDFFQCPDDMVDFAATEASFAPAGHGYPGIRSPVPERLNHALIHALNPVFELLFGITASDALVFESSFSIVTDTPDRSRPAQLLPHFDNSHPKALATVMYLCAPRLGGTSFYRHRSTGFETIGPERAETYNSELHAELSRTAIPERYPDARHPLFERFHSVEPRFNRLVLYRSRLLHSADIPPEEPLTADSRAGRLTITSFLRPV